ncbi:MAG: sigma-70 family RNA polymerase sigma factor [Planctomycetota bacterium]
MASQPSSVAERTQVGRSGPDAQHRFSGDSSLSDASMTLVDRHQGPLIAYARRMLGSGEAAEDAVQETFLRWFRSEQRPDREHAAPWLFRVCRNQIIDMQRKRKADLMEHTETVTDPTPSPETIVANRESADQVARCVSDLTPRQQEVLQLRIQAGLSYREIADVTGLSVSNVGFHLHQAIKTLRQTLVAT